MCVYSITLSHSVSLDNIKTTSAPKKSNPTHHSGVFWAQSSRLAVSSDLGLTGSVPEVTDRETVDKENDVKNQEVKFFSPLSV